MDIGFIEELKNSPYEKKTYKYLDGKFWIEEKFVYKDNRIDGEIRCGIQEDRFWCGSVEVHIEIEKFKNEHHAGFGCLAVPDRIQRQGIGTKLMLSVIEEIKVFKDYYSINDTVVISGWLSTEDKRNRNWEDSVPLYERVGTLANVECYFTINNDAAHYNATTFLDTADDDGYILYMI